MNEGTRHADKVRRRAKDAAKLRNNVSVVAGCGPYPAVVIVAEADAVFVRNALDSRWHVGHAKPYVGRPGFVYMDVHQ